ncbi:type II toxin-antitoxin system PemK/MazF family toxin [Streptomyces sp. WMMC500]|uniref:type II toxin-antitoxin system PemK/MazF family toxin n=1 Tax=Streptomyces sp. WMMC500 TaxID=3015154 RepID=UPI00248D29F2|nr:type II toxin-antitoxin system PemK/MazF family toxin [Streptomyces sp. WMMC500]WBB59102.1 type II toxin-antitoxin system PemK/MazF family toxin [Streptomyces sp. WMMC500]
MDTSWWPAIVAVVVLAVIAGLVDSFGRVRRAHRRPEGERGAGPRPGEVWWARVPDGDDDGDEDGYAADGVAPCLVVKTAGVTVTVARITTRRDGERPGVIPLPPATVDDARGRPGFLATDELREIHLRDFRRRSGPVDPAVWDQVRHLSDT